MTGEGTWRPFLDEVVLKGARAYALRMLAIKRGHQAVVDLATARSRLGSIAAIHTLCDLALDQVAVSAGTVAGETGTAIAALNKVLTYVAQAGSALDKVATEVTALTTPGGVLASALVELGKVNTDLATGAEGVWTDEVKYITGSTGITGAQPHLESGDDKIDLINKGDRVAEMYAAYAGVEIAIAQLWEGKRAHFLEEAARHVDTMNGYFSDAVQRLGICARVVDEAGGRNTMAQEYINEAQMRLGVCQEYSREASYRIEEMQTYSAEADRYMAAADRETAASTRYHQLATEAMAEFQGVLADRAQYRTNVAVASTRQPR